MYQGWEVPLLSEQRLLDLPPRQLALVREVALLLDDSAVVFARSIFPITSLNGSLAHLRRLQNKSLGAFLFKHPGMHRYPFELSRMAGNSDYLPEDLRQPGARLGASLSFRGQREKTHGKRGFSEGLYPLESSAFDASHTARQGQHCISVANPVSYTA